MSSPVRDAIPALKCACGHWAKADEVTECRFCECKDHHPARPYEPQTPVSAESRLDAYSDALEEAGRLLAEARDAELEAEDARDAAERLWTLHADCPKVGAVVDGRRITVAYAAAWVGERIAAEERAYKAAVLVTKAALQHVRKIEKQGSFQQTLANSVDTAYRGTRGGERGW